MIPTNGIMNEIQTLFMIERFKSYLETILLSLVISCSFCIKAQDNNYDKDSLLLYQSLIKTYDYTSKQLPKEVAIKIFSDQELTYKDIKYLNQVDTIFVSYYCDTLKQEFNVYVDIDKTKSQIRYSITKLNISGVGLSMDSVLPYEIKTDIIHGASGRDSWPKVDGSFRTLHSLLLLYAFNWDFPVPTFVQHQINRLKPNSEIITVRMIRQQENTYTYDYYKFR